MNQEIGCIIEECRFGWRLPRGRRRVHGFSNFFGYLYHLDAMKDPAHPGRPQELLDKVGSHKMVHSWATDRDDPSPAFKDCCLDSRGPADLVLSEQYFAKFQEYLLERYRGAQQRNHWEEDCQEEHGECFEVERYEPHPIDMLVASAGGGQCLNIVVAEEALTARRR
jgi:hypothetical protein